MRLSGPGSLEVRLAGDDGDWDVAVFDAAGSVLAADASPDAQEVASGFALKGGTVHVQACRRSGDAASVPATLEHSAIAPGAAEAAKQSRPQLVDVITPTAEQKQRLADLGLDMTEHGGEESLGVVLHGPEDEAALRKAGLRWTVEVDDLVAQDRAARTSERGAAAATPGARASALPSGRERYRTLADYNAELKDLAAKNPNLVKLFTMPEKTYGGKDVLGIEIAENVNLNDGKPAFFNMGVHHAREWPAGELTMEWALELINGYKKGDARATNVVKQLAQHRRADRQRRRLRGLAQRRRDRRPGRRPRRDRRRHRLPRRGRDDRRRVPAQELPPARRLRGRQLHDLGRPRRERRRPEPQLRRPLGRPGRRHQPAHPELPRPRPVLRARVAQRQGHRLAPTR